MFLQLCYYGFGQTEGSLPILKIETKARKINFSDYRACRVDFYITKDSVLLNNAKGQTKFRGNSAAHYKKKSYSLKLSEKTDLIAEKPSKNWKINAEYIDKTFLRNKLSYDLFRQFTTGNYAPHITYTNLYLNKKYKGLYTITERVDADRLKLNTKDTAAVLFKSPPISQEPGNHPLNYKNFVDYYLWAERYKKYSDKELNKVTRRAYFNQRFPDKIDHDKTEIIYELTNFIYCSPDSVFCNYEAFSKYFNLENILDWHLLLLVTNNADGVVKNFYLFKRDKDSPYLFCPWDYDHGYGRDGDGELHTQNIVGMERMELVNRLINLNAFNYKNKLLAKFLSLKEKGILTPGYFADKAENFATEMQIHLIKNEKKWPPKKVHLFKKTNFLAEIKLMTNWMKEHLLHVETYLHQLSSD